MVRTVYVAPEHVDERESLSDHASSTSSDRDRDHELEDQQHHHQARAGNINEGGGSGRGAGAVAGAGGGPRGGVELYKKKISPRAASASTKKHQFLQRRGTLEIEEQKIPSSQTSLTSRRVEIIEMDMQLRFMALFKNN